MDEQTNSRLDKIDEKLDKVSEAIVSLARMEERMITLFKRMDDYDYRHGKLEERVGNVEVKHASMAWIERVVWILIGAIVTGSIIIGK
jgi:tetrahydromethanopterin S-methyltransferase subunit G